MTSFTYYAVLPFDRNEHGELCPGEAVECRSVQGAVAQARLLAAEVVGAVAFSRTGDVDVGEYADAVIITRFGDVPTDLEAAAGAL